MALMRKGFIVAAGLAGGLTAGQAPEFAQQYRQRLGGAIEELQRIVADFDNDAARNGLIREEALGRYAASKDNFLQDRGTSMERVIERHDRLWGQAIRFGSMPPVARPLALARGYDQTLVEGTWSDFEPALPLTTHGLIWSGAGFGLGALLMALLARLTRFKPAPKRSSSAGRWS